MNDKEIYTTIQKNLKEKSRNERKLYLYSLSVNILKTFYRLLITENDSYKIKDHENVDFGSWLKDIGESKDDNLYIEHIINVIIKYRSADTITNIITIKEYIDHLSCALINEIKRKKIRMLVFVDGDQATSTLTHINSIFGDGLHIIVTQREGSCVPQYLKNKRWCTIIHTNDKGKNSSDMMICLEMTNIILKLRDDRLKTNVALITNDHFGKQYLLSISTLYDVTIIDPKTNESLALYLLKHHYDDIKFNRYGDELKEVMDGSKDIDVIKRLKLQEDFKDLIKRFINLKKIKSSTLTYPIYQHIKDTIYNNEVLIDIKNYIVENGHIKISMIEKLFPVDVAILYEHNCKTIKELVRIPQISYFLRCEVTNIGGECAIKYLKDISLPVVHKRVANMSCNEIIMSIKGHWDFEQNITKTCEKYDLNNLIITKILSKNDATSMNLARYNLINFKVWLIDNHEKNMRRCGGL
jgi:hypothetical protein